MAVEYTLEGEPRTITGKKVRELRKQGFVPGTVYGPKTKTQSIQFKYRPLQVMLMQAGGTHIINLKVNNDFYPVLAREVQRDVIKGDILHVDFFVLDMRVKVRVDIPIELTGTSPIVASREGILITGTNTLTVEILPGKLIDKIEVDLSQLTEIGDSISVMDIPLEDADILNEPEEMIAKVVQPSAVRAEEAEELLEETEESSAEPEVIARERDEEDEE